MKYSDCALKILAAHVCGLIKTRAQFAKEITAPECLDRLLENHPSVKEQAVILREKIEKSEEWRLQSNCGFICPFDLEFPVINPKSNRGDRPFLIFYQGDLKLLRDLNRIVAVIGVLNPENGVIEREEKVVSSLVKHKMIILSGLAKGCDAIAHQVCLDRGGKTIAVLPSTLQKIVPAENRELAEKIVAKGGLLMTEYYQETENRFESTQRFVDRDRLQAMFAKAVILSASYRKDEGDSGSRHAMEYARKFHINRYMIFNPDTDANAPQYGLNYDYYINNSGVEILTPAAIETLSKSQNNLLVSDVPPLDSDDQLSFL